MRENSEKMTELQREEDQIQEKRELVQKKAYTLEENIMKFAKIASKSKLNLKGTEFLRKEDTYNDLLSDFNTLIHQKY